MNVAIIGASGIGKHHAKWFHFSGCNVVAFSGTSPESCGRTTEVLRGLFDFQGRSYADYRRMLETESLDIVSVCSPPETHLEQVRAVLEAGLHVYCEKPFAWPVSDALTYPLPPPSEAPGVSHPVLRRTLEDARAVVELAEQRRRILGVNAQYVAAQSAYQKMHEARQGPVKAIESFYFLLESKGVSGRYADNEYIWIDMAPHALSQMIGLMPDGLIDEKSVDCRIRNDETIARFQYGTAWVEAVLRKSPEASLRRRFGVNGFLVDYEARADHEGRFRAFLRYDDRETVMDDLVQMSVHRFLDVIQRGDGKPYVDGHAALKNLEMSMVVLERGRRV